MYLPSHFEEERTEVLHAFVRRHPFGLLVTQRDGGIDANGIPFLLDKDGGGLGILRGHVARANPVWREARAEAEALVVFQGPHGYVSPGWYPSKAQHGKAVPTWNYMMVQARGRLRAIDDTVWLRRFVTRLTECHEASLPAPWAVSDAPEDYIEQMLKAIVGIEIKLGALTGKWKLSQNRSAADRAGVASQLSERGDEMSQALAAAVERGGADGGRV